MPRSRGFACLGAPPPGVGKGLVKPWSGAGPVEGAAAFDDVCVGLVAFGAVAFGVRGLLVGEVVGAAAV